MFVPILVYVLAPILWLDIVSSFVSSKAVVTLERRVTNHASLYPLISILVRPPLSNNAGSAPDCYFHSLYQYEFVAKFSPLFPPQMPKRNAIIQQLKDIKVLKDDGILSTDEFNK